MIFDSIAAPPPTLPDALRFESGALLRAPEQWPARRLELAARMLPLAYGVLPPAPRAVSCEILHAAPMRCLQGARLLSCRVGVDGGAAFMLRVWVPADSGALPVVLNGDGCWHYADDSVLQEALRRGYVFAQFNRVEVSADKTGQRSPEHGPRLLDGQSCGAIAAWAWAYHRAIDALATLDCVNSQAIAVVGHSRGGKAALLAGATDPRIALTSANNSGAAGAGCFRLQQAGSETLADITQNFPHWFGGGLAAFAGREHDLPFDQHFLKALVAPRALLTTEALGDHWSNPEGSWHTHCAARRVYQFLGARQALAISFRQGGHDHGLADWMVFLDYCDTVFAGRQRSALLDVSPFGDVNRDPDSAR